jgi:hypothetical protein
VWLVFKIDGLINAASVEPQRPFHFVGIRGLLARISPVCAFLRLTCITLFVLVLLCLVAAILAGVSRARRQETKSL